MKPIETHYKGYRFRSRLEARWAVFFDRADIRYEYEEEGFEFNGIRYLPDFHLTGLDCWVEIKPASAYPPGVELIRTMRMFGCSVGPIICFFGLPGLGWNGVVYCQDVADSGAGGDYESRIGFAFCQKHQKFTLSFSDEDSRFLAGSRHLYKADWSSWNSFCDPTHRHSHTLDELTIPITAARQARFEHGETP